MSDGKHGRYIRIEGTTWPDPVDASEIDWTLRYGKPEDIIKDRLYIASIVSSYTFLVRGCYDRDAHARLLRGVKLARDGEP